MNKLSLKKFFNNDLNSMYGKLKFVFGRLKVMKQDFKYLISYNLWKMQALEKLIS